MKLNKDNRRGIIGTAVFHVIILAILLLLGLKYQEPPPETGGVEVNFGTSDQGMGDIQPLQPSPQKSTTVPEPTSVSKDDIVTQNTEDAPAIQDPQKKKTDKVEKPKKEPKKEPKKDPEKIKYNPADYLNKSNNNKTGGNEGETGKPGDQGNPYGDPEAKNHYGTPGSGGGPSFSLVGRKSKYLPKPSKNFKEQGTVVVKIWVNKKGTVTRVEAGARGSTTTNRTLWRLAEEAAKKAKFSVKENAPEVQKGTITYYFIKLN